MKNNNTYNRPWEKEVVTVNTCWKVINGCKRIQRELREGKTIPKDIEEQLREAFKLTQCALYGSTYTME